MTWILIKKKRVQITCVTKSKPKHRTLFHFDACFPKSKKKKTEIFLAVSKNFPLGEYDQAAVTKPYLQTKRDSKETAERREINENDFYCVFDDFCFELFDLFC